MTVPALATRLDGARQALIECRSDFERMRIRDEALAVREAAGILRRKDIQVEASVLVQEAERAIARANPPQQGRRNDFVTSDHEVPISPDMVRQMRSAHASLSDEAFENRIGMARASQEPLTRRSLRTNPTDVLTGDNEWYTPRDVIDRARRALGGVIDLDPASNEWAQEWIGAERHFSAGDDGLAHEWSGRIWMNPPYGKGMIGAFVNKLLDSPAVTSAVVITGPYFDTRYGQRLMREANAVCFVSGRLKFVKRDGERDSPPFAQIFHGVRVDKTLFRDAFQEIGTIWES